MRKETWNVDGVAVDVWCLNTVVVGSGAAGFNAADTLAALGQRDITVVTQGVGMGTSRNAGSDKQTYYKLQMAGGTPDSVRDMAESYFAGGCMHGDLALVEAAGSVRAFCKLAGLGVPFPANRYGEFVGYRTDHDERLRATSAGPLTSKLMTEKLEASVRSRGVPILDGFQVIGILTDGEGEEKRAVGLAALNRAASALPGAGLTLFDCTNVVFATGGPAGLYERSVYPESQTGMSGIAFEAGAVGANLTEWQYGIASTKFRWNLSGTYQQAIPRYVSAAPDGGDEREFLNGRFDTPGRMLTAVFLKGYQWPFDPRKVSGCGSSLIDLLVAEECAKGRRVFLDYTRNPAAAGTGGGFDFSLLGSEAYGYLKNSGALSGTPFDRLMRMNPPAVALYRDHGIDLAREYLEIAVCAQHNNGGLRGNIWFESNIRHLFPVGEANGLFGVYRPGGSALNSTQVDSDRAARYICARYGENPLPPDEFRARTAGQVAEKFRLLRVFASHIGPTSSLPALIGRARSRMTGYGAQTRRAEEVGRALSACRADLRRLEEDVRPGSVWEIRDAFIYRDILISQLCYLEAMRTYIEKGGASRGSCLICDAAGVLPPGLPESLRFRPVDGRLRDVICETRLEEGKNGPRCVSEWVPVRPVPEADEWFENVWADYRDGRTVR